MSGEFNMTLTSFSRELYNKFCAVIFTISSSENDLVSLTNFETFLSPYCINPKSFGKYQSDTNNWTRVKFWGYHVINSIITPSDEYCPWFFSSYYWTDVNLYQICKLLKYSSGQQWLNPHRYIIHWGFTENARDSTLIRIRANRAGEGPCKYR